MIAENTERDVVNNMSPRIEYDHEKSPTQSEGEKRDTVASEIDYANGFLKSFDFDRHIRDMVSPKRKKVKKAETYNLNKAITLSSINAWKDRKSMLKMS